MTPGTDPRHIVAPHAGAWIETREIARLTHSELVAPHAGAWIETSSVYGDTGELSSLLTRERGLKRYDSDIVSGSRGSLLTRERGLKPEQHAERNRDRTSLLTRERGLKHLGGEFHILLLSRSSRGSVD